MEFSAYPVGIEFRLFGPPHLTALGLVVATNVMLWRLRRALNPKRRRAVRVALAATILVAFVGYLGWRLWVGLFDVRSDLPLHLCDVMAVVTVIALVTGREVLYDFVYFAGIGGAAQALLTSNVGIYGYPHVYFISSMAAHGAIVTTGLFLAGVDGYRPTWRSLWRVAAWTLAYVVAIFGLNRALGSNYLFIGHKPEFASLIDYLGPWPWYVLSLVAIGLVVFHLLYVPFAWHEWRARANRASRSSATPRTPNGRAEHERASG